MVEDPPIVTGRDSLLAVTLGAEALFAMVPPWCGLGMGAWIVYLACATLGFALSMRFLWSH